MPVRFLTNKTYFLRQYWRHARNINLSSFFLPFPPAAILVCVVYFRIHDWCNIINITQWKRKWNGDNPSQRWYITNNVIFNLFLNHSCSLTSIQFVFMCCCCCFFHHVVCLLSFSLLGRLQTYPFCARCQQVWFFVWRKLFCRKIRWLEIINRWINLHTGQWHMYFITCLTWISLFIQFYCNLIKCIESTWFML